MEHAAKNCAADSRLLPMAVAGAMTDKSTETALFPKALPAAEESGAENIGVFVQKVLGENAGDEAAVTRMIRGIAAVLCGGMLMKERASLDDDRSIERTKNVLRCAEWMCVESGRIREEILLPSGDMSINTFAALVREHMTDEDFFTAVRQDFFRSLA
jgi:hypothetical protein